MGDPVVPSKASGRLPSAACLAESSTALLVLARPPSSYMAYMLDLAGRVANFFCLFPLPLLFVIYNQCVVTTEVCDLLRHGCCEERANWAPNAIGRLSVQFQQNGAEFRCQQREQFKLVPLFLYVILLGPGLQICSGSRS